MSHFTVMTMGDPDYQLAPFHEFECTGIDNEFVQTIDKTEEKREEFEKAKTKYKKKLVEIAEKIMEAQDEELPAIKAKLIEETKYCFKKETFLEYIRDYEGYTVVGKNEPIDLEGAHKYSYAIDKGNDNLKVFRRTNPNAVWDWYVEGGRWEGILLLKEKDKNGEDQFTNKALKKDIDFEEMWKRKETETRERYRRVIEILGKVPSVEHTWESLMETCVDEEGNFKREEANAIYDKQEDVILWRSKNKKLANAVGYFSTVDDFTCNEEEYLRRKSIHALSYGIIKDRKYYAKGEMGWWACSFNEKEPMSWDEEYKKLIESCDDDTLITLVDCHI